MTATQTLSVQRPHDGVLVLHLNRPERLNAINEVMLDELTGTLTDVASDTSVNALVVTGAGRGFCSGIDMRDFGAAAPEATAPAIDRLRFQEAMAALPQAIRDLPQPVIAAVNGPCVGAGLALCLAADIRICSTAATFGNAAILTGVLITRKDIGATREPTTIVFVKSVGVWKIASAHWSAIPK